MALAPGSKLGPYQIQSPLGAGGMGEVYRATDTKLGRDVALKVLPADLAKDPARLGRFRREAKSLAQLDHPNIVTIYSVEECDGVHFLTMQLVEGLALDRLIPQGGLGFEQIVEIATALGDALAAAHEKGIVHRDLKPCQRLAERAKKLNPNHPGWYWASDFYQAFSAGDYRKAVSFGQKAKLQGFPLASMLIAAACGQLGDVEGGTKAVADLVKFRPELAAIMPKQVAKVWNAEYGARFLEGLREAGMQIPA